MSSNLKPKLLPMRPVESTHLAQAGYDPPSKTLQVQFTRQPKIYQYYGVPHGTYVAMMAAKSIGSFFNQRVRAKYTGVDVTPKELLKAVNK